MGFEGREREIACAQMTPQLAISKFWCVWRVPASPKKSRGQRGEREKSERERELHLHLSGDSGTDGQIQIQHHRHQRQRGWRCECAFTCLCTFCLPVLMCAWMRLAMSSEVGARPAPQRQTAGCRSESWGLTPPWVYAYVRVLLAVKHFEPTGLKVLTLCIQLLRWAPIHISIKKNTLCCSKIGNQTDKKKKNQWKLLNLLFSIKGSAGW